MTSVHSKNDLRIGVKREDGEIRVVWEGRSTARDPVTFIGPILTSALVESTNSGTPLVLDFRGLVYMNSSTITPVIRLLREAGQGTGRVLVLYQRGIRWQELNFSALTIFETDDKRIEIRGV